MKIQYIFVVALVSILAVSAGYSALNDSDDSYYNSTQFVLDSEKASSVTNKKSKASEIKKVPAKKAIVKDVEKEVEIVDLQKENERIVEQIEKEREKIEEILVFGYTQTTPDNPDYDVAKEILLGTFNDPKLKLIEAKQVFHEPTPHKKGEFDAAKYLIDLEKTKDYSKYYVKPTPHKKDDFDAALFLLNQEKNN